MLMHEHDQRYIADTARVMGEVELGTDVGVWYGALIRRRHRRDELFARQ